MGGIEIISILITTDIICISKPTPPPPKKKPEYTKVILKVVNKLENNCTEFNITYYIIIIYLYLLFHEFMRATLGTAQ